MEQESRLIMPSLRSSIRRRLEAEEAEQDNPAEEQKAIPSNRPTTCNPVEQAAQEAIQAKLDEQPDPVVEPKKPRYEEDDDEDLTTTCMNLN